MTPKTPSSAEPSPRREAIAKSVARLAFAALPAALLAAMPPAAAQAANAHCPAPARNPSRTAVFTGIRGAEPVKLFWMSREGDARLHADIAPKGRHRQQTRPGAVRLIADARRRPRGCFRVGDRGAGAEIPEPQRSP